MLFKKTFAFVPRHADENSSLADVDSKTEMPKLFYEAGDLVKCFKELGSGAEDPAPEEVIRVDLQIRKINDVCQPGRDVARIACPDQGRQCATLPHPSRREDV